MTQKFDRRMLPITSAMAAALLATGCSRSPDTADRDVRVCRDAQGRRVEDRNCSWGGSGGGHGWYYLGRGSAVGAWANGLVAGRSPPPMAIATARHPRPM